MRMSFLPLDLFHVVFLLLLHLNLVPLVVVHPSDFMFIKIFCFSYKLKLFTLSALVGFFL